MAILAAIGAVKGVAGTVGSIAKGVGGLLGGGDSGPKDAYGNPVGEAAQYGFTEAQWSRVTERHLVRERGFPTRQSLVDAGLASDLATAALYSDNMAVEWYKAGKLDASSPYVPKDRITTGGTSLAGIMATLQKPGMLILIGAIATGTYFLIRTAR